MLSTDTSIGMASRESLGRVDYTGTNPGRTSMESVIKPIKSFLTLWKQLSVTT
jgi:hypothetical protein